jgi:hypothetical protein
MKHYPVYPFDGEGYGLVLCEYRAPDKNGCMRAYAKTTPTQAEKQLVFLFDAPKAHRYQKELEGLHHLDLLALARSQSVIELLREVDESA